ncbi:Gfo/Idh/MocA family oxidoreductase [Flammeovirgaceae bacterium SG7u.111]|nr:Gfo/Idh/MocA family oxidoreductase [Flammeovirgaceae bacterium SG7u.132]WPO36522.1 Gfo/Idh/MocA family oxidoreductase [Flammeovirgaceae bacterium SG7u.111]
MRTEKNEMKRREFIGKTAAVGTLLATNPISSLFANGKAAKMKIALVGTGVRGVSMWGKALVEEYAGQVEFVGLCDINPGRLKYGKDFIGADCNTYTDFEAMMKKEKPDTVIVTTVDATHHEFIIKAMEMGANVITEKPMTTDETKCQAILDAEKKTGKKTTVTFNYRYSPHRQKIYELLRAGEIGDITSVDFHWYLDTNHGASYFRRWHGLRERGGTLLVHKSTHHFDLLNWWLDSEPAEVFAFGELEHYGKNGAMRGESCRTCTHKDSCDFHWDITKSKHLMGLYAENEEHDGYIRDSCVFREKIDIYDKMAATIKYANDVTVSYSLTTYSPYEGYRIAFNGTKGRLEAWIQERQPWDKENYDELRLTKNFGKTELIRIPHSGGGHGGGDTRLKDKIFKTPDMADPYRQSAGTRDGAMSILVGIAARNSIESGKPVKIADLTSLKPMAKRP